MRLTEKEYSVCEGYLLECKQKDRICDDTAIIASVISGDVNLFEVLVNRYSKQVFTIVCRRVPANDVEQVAQDAFVSAFRSLHNYKPHQPFEHWLGRIARRRCYDYWRHRESRVEFTPSQLSNEKSYSMDSISAKLSVDAFALSSDQKETSDMVSAALARLSAEDRTLMECVYFEELPLKEAANVLNWSLAKTKVRALRARRKLRDIISRLFRPE